MNGAERARQLLHRVRPVFSTNPEEAKRNYLALYKDWQRKVPWIKENYKIPKTEEQIRAKIREEFRKHKDVKDIRVIDILVVKGRQELVETVKKWKQETHVMRYWDHAPQKKKSSDFMSKFLSNRDEK